MIKKLKCIYYKKNLSRYIDNDLSLFQKKSLERHLESCPGCLEILSEYKKISSSLKSNFSPVPEILWNRIEKRLSLQEQNKTEKRIFSLQRQLLIPSVIFIFITLFTVTFYFSKQKIQIQQNIEVNKIELNDKGHNRNIGEIILSEIDSDTIVGEMIDENVNGTFLEKELPDNLTEKT